MTFVLIISRGFANNDLYGPVPFVVSQLSSCSLQGSGLCYNSSDTRPSGVCSLQLLPGNFRLINRHLVCSDCLVLENWLPQIFSVDQPCCLDSSVTCGAGDRIESLYDCLFPNPTLNRSSLAHKGLTGTIPVPLSALSELKYLYAIACLQCITSRDLTNNSLTGSIPPQLANLTLLHTL